MSILGELSAFNAGTWVELYEIDLTKFGQPIFRFHNGVNEKYEPVVWQGNTYQPFPAQVSGFEVSGQGFARPKIVVANHTGIITAALKSYNQLLGCKFTRKRTMMQYLDAVNFPSQKNLYLNTEDLSAAYWTKTRTTITTNAILSPDGFQTADKLVATNTTGAHYIFRGMSFTSGVHHRLSIYAKAGEYSLINLWTTNANSTFGNEGVSFNLANGTVWGITGNNFAPTITSVGNGWYRCSITVIPLTTATGNIGFGIHPSTDTGGFLASFTGDNTSGVYYWGAQLEVGDNATEYQKIGTSWNANPTADNTQQLPPDVFFIAQKTKEDKYTVEFELASAVDLQGVLIPKRQVISNLCPFKYRGEECGYIGGAVADVNDNPTTNSLLDDCSRTVTGCKYRFGETGELSFGGFIGSSLVKVS